MPDNSNNKLIAKNTILLYIRSFFTLFISFYTSRVVLQVLGVDDYGIYNVVGGVVSMFSMLSSTLTSASQRYITFYLGKNDGKKLSTVFSTCVNLHVILAVICVIILELLGIWFLNNKLNIPADRLYAASIVMHFSIASFFVSIISTPYTAEIIAHEKMGVFAYISILDAVLKLGVVFLLVLHAGDKLITYSFLLFLMTLVTSLIYIIYSIRKFEEARKLNVSIERGLFKEMFAFSGWNFIGIASVVLRRQGIDVLLNMFFGVRISAAKGICNQVEGVVSKFVSDFTTAVNPQLTKSIATSDYERSYSLITHGSKISFFLMMLIAVPFILCTNDILSLWLVNVPEFATEMVQITFILLLTDLLSRFLVNAILAYGDLKNFQLIDGVVKLLALPATYLFLKLGGDPMTGIWVNVAISLFTMFPRAYYARKFIQYDLKIYFSEVVLKSTLTFISSFVAILLISRLFTCSVWLIVPLSLFISSGFIWLIGLNKDEKIIVKRYIVLFIRRHSK